MWGGGERMIESASANEGTTIANNFIIVNKCCVTIVI